MTAIEIELWAASIVLRMDVKSSVLPWGQNSGGEDCSADQSHRETAMF